jgi:hypothetical protein
MVGLGHTKRGGDAAQPPGRQHRWTGEPLLSRITRTSLAGGREMQITRVQITDLGRKAVGMK